MTIDSRLRARLEPLARSKHRLRLSLMLAGCWAIAGFAGLALMALENVIGWYSWLALPLVALVGIALSAMVVLRFGRQPPDWRLLARQIEAKHPELDGLLLTAVQQGEGGDELHYLQQRVLDEAIAHHDRTDWGAMLPHSRVLAAQAAQICAFIFAAVVIWGLRVPGSHRLVVPRGEVGVTVTPGDVELERGSSLVVLAEFKGRVPSKVDLVLNASGESASRIPLVRSLADPLFGATLPEVSSNFVYHLEYAGRRTRDFKVTVFEYPRLERADAEITFPEYTAQAPKRIDNTRRLSAVEGSRLNLMLHLNKSVQLASLISKDASRSAVSLSTASNSPAAALKGFLLARSVTYELQLVDLEGRTNKVPAQFVFEALKNRPPELKVAMPRGDIRPSALEEITFEGTVWDDFGVRAYGLAYSVNSPQSTVHSPRSTVHSPQSGESPKFEVQSSKSEDRPEWEEERTPRTDGGWKVLELGHQVPGKEKQTFKYLLRLEDLGVQPDDLLSWFVWADDVGPDGKVRRTTGDLFFAEVRPFEEIFRQGQDMSGGQEQQQMQGGGEGGAAGRLGELQKQIINATWNLFRRTGASFEPGKPTGPETNKVDESTSSSSSSSSFSSSSSNDKTTSITRRRTRTRTIGTAQGLFVAQLAGQVAPSSPERPSRGSGRAPRREQASPASLPEDLGVVTEAQSDAIEQAQAAQERQQDARNARLWQAVIQQMERALGRLNAATNSPAAFQEALAAERAAYQALLKLQEREYSVSRSRNRQRGQGGRQQQLQRQLDQLDLTTDENRYETERQAQAPQTAERRERLQVMNRLEELARRQQDVNERLKELQTALQEARTEKEREEIRRRLKRLEEQEQQLIADADEARQRMDRPENQARMSDQRRQLEQAREDLQRAAEATEQGQPSQALAAGTRAQREFQQMRDDLRKQSASEFEDDLRRMRAEARELARQQEEVHKDLDAMNDRARRTLSDSDLNQQALERIAHQAERLTNLVQNATQLSQQAEAAEPLMSRELYDSLRKFSQNESSTLKQFQEELMRELMTRGMTSRELYERVKRIGEQSGSKALDLTSEMLRQGLLQDAALTEEQARAGINDLKRGVERAAESVLGDDTESLRLAAQELDRLANQLRREIAQAEGGQTNGLKGEGGGALERGGGDTNQPGQLASAGLEGNPKSDPAVSVNAGTQERNQAETAGRNPKEIPNPKSEAQNAADSKTAGNRASLSTGQGEQGENQNLGESPRNTDGTAETQRSDTTRSAGPRFPGRNGGARVAQDFDRLFDGRGGAQWGGPITGEDFGPWSDGLRNIEEIVDTPSLRNDVARARERARQMRQDFRRSQTKPDWAVVRVQVLAPLVEVRDAIAEELARREPRDNLVPIDRDPVPDRYSELVRRYYEQLGKAEKRAPARAPALPESGEGENRPELEK